jgi:arginine/lysine/ornithine decarboxylase
MASVGCPPAVPIAVAGEVIDENVIECFKYYGIVKVNVIK